MDQARHNRWDTIIKSTALILSVCLAVFGFWQYRELKEREFKKEFYKKQIETIDEVVKILLSYGTTEKNKDKLYMALQQNLWVPVRADGRVDRLKSFPDGG